MVLGTSELRFSTVHESNRTMAFDDLTRVLIFAPEDLFLLAREQFGHRIYSRFRSLRQLELLLLARRDMYAIVQTEFEHAITDGLRAAKERGVGR